MACKYVRARSDRFVRSSIAKTKNLLKQAETLLKNEMYDGSINRSYYAIFNAIRSLLSLVKLDSKKHSGILSFFDRYFVKTKLIDKQFSYIAHSAFESRQNFDYEDFSFPSEEEAHSQYEDAKLLIAEVEQKRAGLIKGALTLPEIA